MGELRKLYPFNEEWVGWQFGSWATSAGYDFTQLEITIAYTGNCNVSKFTNIFLHREKFGVSFGYENGNVYSTSNLAGQKSDIKYDSADNVGNPIGDGRWSYCWKAGRMLDSMAKTGTSILFDYDQNDLRIGKTVNGVKTHYTMHREMLTHMTKGTDFLHFFYDKDSRPAFVEYNNVKYAYVYNLQDDVVALLDASGTIVINYKYNEWGRELSVTGSLANSLGLLNPIRYRCYIYDSETGLYYLRNRYYNPETGRFLSPDLYSKVAEDKQFANKNLYAYCNNNPVNRIDENGCGWFLASIAAAAVGAVVGAVVGAAVSAVGQLISGSSIDLKSVAVAAGSGAITGAFATTKHNVVAQMVVGGVVGAAAYVAECAWRDDKEFNGWELAGAAAGGAAAGLIGGAGIGNELKSAYSSAQKIIIRETRRVNQDYAAKMISRATVEYTSKVVSASSIAALKYTAGVGLGTAVGRFVSQGVVTSQKHYSSTSLFTAIA